MPALASFDYAVVRVVPRVERAEFVNAGVIVFCRTRRYLAARVRLDRTRLAIITPDPDPDLDEVARHLDVIPRICSGGRDAGPIGAFSIAERFHWLVAPRSTVIQTAPVHCGLCDDPAIALDRLFNDLVPSPLGDVTAAGLD